MNNQQRGEAPEKLVEERGLPSINGRKGGSKFGRYAGIAALAAVVAVMIWMTVSPAPKPVEEEEVSGAQTRRNLPPLELAPDPVPPPPPPAPAPAAAPTPPGGPSLGGTGTPAKTGPSEEELLLMRRQRAPIFAFGGGGQGTAAPVGAALPGAQPTEESGLGASLKPTRTDAVRASMLPDRNFLIAKGTFLDCALITAITSTQPGMTSCRLTRNIYSDNGKVLLLERGSIIEGEYQAGQMRQGMDRIFVLWTRVRTPKGVVVSLDSPGADELGRSGLRGWVDTHFWSRFGGALLLSLVESATEYAIAQQQERNGDTISLGGAGDATQEAAAIALQNSINIPPTLNVNQGDLINIYVARDLDFRGVYELRSAH